MDGVPTRSAPAFRFDAFPLFHHCNAIDLARALPHVERLELAEGEPLYRQGNAADYLYFVLDGEVLLRLDGLVVDHVEEGSLGEEAGLGSRYRTDAVSAQPTVVARIPREALRLLLANTPELHEALLGALLNHHLAPEGDEAAAPKAGGGGRPAAARELIGWPLAALLPLLIFHFGDQWGFDWNAKTYLAVFVATFTLWILRITHESVPALFAVVALGGLGVVPKEVVLSGFTSSSFFLAMSVFGLGAVLVGSGLTFRVVLHILRRLPANQSAFWLGLMGVGAAMTPVLPSANGRATLMAPLVRDARSSLGYRDGDRAATRLAVMAFMGITLFSPIFLTSKSVNLVVYGLMPAQVQSAFHWSSWLGASLAAGAVLLFGTALLARWWFRNEEVPRVSRGCIESQLKILGPLSLNEWAAVIGILLLGLGILTKSLHKLDPSWVALIILYSLLTLGAMTQRQFRARIDWSFLFVLAGMIGLIQTMSHVGVDRWIAAQLTWLGPYIREDFGLFVLLLSMTLLAVRLLVPINAAIVIFATIFIPMAESAGVNPWVVGFVILMMSDAWFLPVQSTAYGIYQRHTNRDGLYDDRALLKFNLVANGVRLAAVYASIPYWEAMNIL